MSPRNTNRCAQTIFSYSRAALKALQEAYIKQLETAAAQLSEDDDPFFRNSMRQALDIARHTAYTSGTLTITKNGDDLKNIRLELIVEANEFTFDRDGKFLWQFRFQKQQICFRKFRNTANFLLHLSINCDKIYVYDHEWMKEWAGRPALSCILGGF